jgi:DME family drug/metabolite transporter
MQPHTERGPLLVALAAALWGTTGTAQALGPEGISPQAVSGLRMAGGALLLGYAFLRRDTVPLRRLIGWPLFWCIATMAVSQPLFFTGVERTGVAVGTIVTIGSGPILGGLVAWLVRRERPGRRWFIATLLALIGAVLLLSGGESAGVDPGGLLFAFGAGLAWAIYLVAAKSLFETHPPVFVAGVVFAGAAVALSPILVASDLGWLGTTRGLAVVLWLGLVATATSYVMFSRGLSATPVASAATLTLAEPLTAAVLGMVILDEPIRATTIAGIGLVGLGIIALTYRVNVAPPSP